MRRIGAALRAAADGVWFDFPAIGIEREEAAAHADAMDAAEPSLTPNSPHPVQVAAWRKMGASRRAELGAALRRQVRGWKRDALRTRHPDWTEEQVRRELAQIYLRGNT